MKPILRAAIAVLGASALLAVASCAAPASSARADRVEQELPQALLSSDLGVAGAEATQYLDGFTHNIGATIDLERGSVTAAELRDILAVFVDTLTTDPEAYGFVRVGVRDAGSAASTDVYGSKEYVDLAPAAQELGLEPTSASGKNALAFEWSDVVALVQE